MDIEIREEKIYSFKLSEVLKLLNIKESVIYVSSSVVNNNLVITTSKINNN